MGLVTAAEADQAADIARTTSGVTRVVRVFELIKRPPVEPAAAPPK
jgi:osmotically-inducible protein OsmY